MALLRSATTKSLVLVPMGSSARQSVGSCPVLLNYSMTLSHRQQMTWYVQYTVTTTAFFRMFNVQVHTDKGSEGGPSSADPVKLTWRRGGPAPEDMKRSSGTVVVHERTAYFSVQERVFSYTVSGLRYQSANLNDLVWLS